MYSILHPLSNVIIIGGLIIIGIGWRGIHSGNGELVTDGIYRFVRHPQYTGFAMTIIGFLIQWPTIITMVMAPILMVMYRKLAKKEEKNMLQLFGKKYEEYSKQVPAFIPIPLRNRVVKS